MSHTGILRSWNDDKGFGFIAPTHGGREVFVHISAFPRDGTRPTVGETLSFELGQGKDGRPQAIRITRAAIGANQPVRSRPQRIEKRGWGGLIRTALLLGLLLTLGSIGYQHFQASLHRRELAQMPPTVSPTSPHEHADTAPATSAGAFRCDGRTHCSQMTSCSEAKWFLNHCPGTKMDGNNDGVPCEQQWCTNSFSR